MKYDEVIQSQYGNSPTLKALIRAMYDEIAPEEDFQTFYKNIFNLDTASGIGLNIWGRILGIGREIKFDSVFPLTPLLGYNRGRLNPFDQGVFYNPDNVYDGSVTQANLEDSRYRELLKFKAYVNIGKGILHALNDASFKVFGHYDISATNITVTGTLPNGDMYNEQAMHISWVVRKDELTNLDLSFIKMLGEMTVPAGVDQNIHIVAKDPLFGFAGSRLTGFNHGNFSPLAVFNV